MIAPIQQQEQFDVGSRVRVARWVLKRMNIPNNHPIALARGRIVKMDGGPHGPDYAETKFSGKLLKAKYYKLNQLEPA